MSKHRRTHQEVVVYVASAGVLLEEYRRRISQLASTCKATGQRCVFLTQPSIWKEDMSPEEEKRLWLGWVGPIEAPKGYGRTSELAKAMLAYNNTLLSTRSSNGLECYDLASAVPRSQKYFSDDLHFTEAGARLVAEYLATNLKFRK